MSDDAVKISITADVSGVKKGMDEAADAVGGMQRKVSDDLARVGREAEEAETPIGALADTIRDFTREQRQEGFLGNYMAIQIQQLGFASKSAAGEVTGFISAFAFGGGFGVAAESVKFLIEKFQELRAEETKAAKAAFDAEDAGYKRLNEEAAQYGQKLYALSGASKEQIAARKELQPYLDAERDAQEAISEATRNVAKAKSEVYTVTRQQGDGEEVVVTRGLDAVENAKAALAVAEQQLAAAQKLTEEHEALYAPVAKAEAQKDSELALPSVDSASKEMKRLAEEEKKASDKLVATLLEADKKIEASRLKRIDAGLEAEQLATKEAIRLEDERLARAIAADKREQEETKKAAEELKKAAHDAMAEGEKSGNALGAALVAVGEHSKDAGAKMKAMAGDALGAIEKVILGYVAQAAAASASAVGGVPIVGPALAVGAAATVFGGLQYLIHSAAGGFDIPGGTNPITQLHEREMVLPATYADMIRRMAASPSGGGMDGGIHIHPRSTDVPGELVRTAREMRRNGRTR